MRVVFLGPPGAGKGTQAVRVSQSADVPHVATGDMFREAVAAGTDLGRQAKAYMDAGRLVPDEVTVGIVRERLAAPDCTAGFVLDGFPRTIPQAESLDSLLSELRRPVTDVIHLVVSREELLRRLTGRRVCPACGATYHLASQPPRAAGACDACGARVVQRADDSEETVRQRLAVYEEQTAPLVGRYADQGKLRRVLGDADVEEVARRVLAALGSGGRR